MPQPLQSRAVTSSKPFAGRVFSLSAIGKWGREGRGEVVLIYLARGIVRISPADLSVFHLRDDPAVYELICACFLGYWFNRF